MRAFYDAIIWIAIIKYKTYKLIGNVTYSCHIDLGIIKEKYEVMRMEYEIVNLKEKSVIGLMKKTTNHNGQAMMDIGLLWQDFFERGFYNNIPCKVNHKTIGLYTDYEGDYTKPYHFLACSEVSDTGEIDETLKTQTSYEANSVFVKKTIEAGTYARFIIYGDVQKSVGEFWCEFWKNCEAMNLERNYTFDFEEYQNNTNDMTNQEIHIYISIK